MFLYMEKRKVLIIGPCPPVCHGSKFKFSSSCTILNFQLETGKGSTYDHFVLWTQVSSRECFRRTVRWNPWNLTLYLCR